VVTEEVDLSSVDNYSLKPIKKKLIKISNDFEQKSPEYKCNFDFIKNSDNSVDVIVYVIDKDYGIAYQWVFWSLCWNGDNWEPIPRKETIKIIEKKEIKIIEEKEINYLKNRSF